MALNGRVVIGIFLRQLLPSDTLAFEQICENECKCASPLRYLLSGDSINQDPNEQFSHQLCASKVFINSPPDS
jgi:hypothetical protein